MEKESNKFILVNEKSELQSNLSQFLKNIGLLNAGKRYNIISIIGSQSSGKSTLLNRLFGTNFDELNSGVKRQQTTKGIWISRDQAAPLMIMDVEGSDSKERWDERNYYEQTTALFALALSQLLIINIWTHEVGRFSGSQYGILKVIFEMNIKLFRQDSTKQLLFILRDFSDDENYENITNLIKNDINKIWSEIAKPPHMQNVQPESMFKIDFFRLLHIKYCPKEFTEGIEKLKSQFTNPTDGSFFFKNFEYEKNLPIDGLQLFVEEIWKTIKSQKDLNLPSQKVMVANLRCGQIKSEAMDQGRPKITDLKNRTLKQPVSHVFGEECQKILEGILEFYDEKANEYKKDVVLEIRQELEQSIYNELFQIFGIHMGQIKKTVLETFAKFLKDMELGLNNENLNTFMKSVEKALVETYSLLDNLILKAIVREKLWDISPIEAEIKENIETEKRNHVEKFLKRFISQKEKLYKSEIESEVEKSFSRFNNTIWEEFRTLYNEHKTRARNEMLNVLKDGFKLPEDFAKVTIEGINEESYKALEAEIGKKIVEVNFYMNKRFKFDFLRNEQGVLRDWKSISEPEISTLCEKSKKITIETFEQLKSFRLMRDGILARHSGVPQEVLTVSFIESPVLIGQEKYQEILLKFEQDAKDLLEDAIRKHNKRGKSLLPMWYILLALVLGFNDIFNLMKSSLFMYLSFITIIIFGFSFAIGYKNLPSVVFKSAYGKAHDKYGPTLSRVSSKVMNKIK